MRAARILVVIIVVNVLLGVLAASVVLSPEYAAIDAAVRKGETLAVRDVVKPADWKQQLLPPRQHCGAFCRARRALVLRFFSEDELLRAYAATH